MPVPAARIRRSTEMRDMRGVTVPRIESRR